MVNKNFIFLFLGLLLLLSLSSVSALWKENTFVDDTLKEKSLNQLTKYGTYEIKEYAWYDPLKIFQETKIKDITLTDNTEKCVDCLSEGSIILYKEGKLVDDLIWKRSFDGGETFIDWNGFTNWKFYVENKNRYEEVDNFETVCVKTKELSLNGTAIQECSQVKNGTRTIDHGEWELIDFDKEYPADTYNWKIEGGKKGSTYFDWIIETEGQLLTNWAVWGNISLGDDAEIILNSPADASTSYTNNVLFNSSSNISSGGATLVNMSACTNETGSWVCGYNSTNTIGSRTYEDLNSTLKTNLESYWKLDESSGAVLDADSGDDGTNQGASASADGISNTAYTFSGGASRIEMDTENRLRGTSGITSGSLWMKGTSPDTFVISKGNGYQDGEADHWALYVNTAGLLGLQTLNNDNKQEIISSSNVSDGDWHHIYFQFGTSGMMLYIDGVSENPDGGKTQQSGLDGTDLVPFAIGSNFRVIHGTWQSGFVGTIDEVAVWSRALNTDEISFLAGQAPTHYTHAFNRTIDDSIIWNVQACDSDGDCGFATSNYSLSIDTTAPSISVDYPSGLVNTLVEGQTLQLNYSVIDTNRDTCWYSYNGTNTTIADCDVNETFTYAFGVNNLTLYANDSVGNLGSDTTSWSAKIIENSQTFSETTVEGSIEDFSVNLTMATGIEVASATLEYNGESESASINSLGDIRILSVSNFEIPSYAVETNVSFYWSLTLNDASVINLTSRNQTVTTIALDNCSGYTNQLFNISLYDEEVLTPLLGTIELYYEVLNVPNYNTIQNYSGKFTNVSNTLVCSEANLSGQNLVYSTEIRYYADDYATELYHIQRGSLDESETIGLYDLALNDTTEFKATYENSNVVKVADAIIQLQRKYIAENLYRTVEGPITGADGTAILHVDLDTNKYRAVVVKNGEILDIFENLVFDCENELSGICEIDLFSDIDSQNSIAIENLDDFSYGISSSNGTVTITFSVPSGEPSTINIQLAQLDQFGNETLCNRTVISSSGSIECTYNVTIGDSYLTLRIYKDGIVKAIKSYIIPEAGAVDFLDNNFFIVFIFMLSIIGMAFTSPEWIVVNSVITMLMAGSLWLLNGLNFVMGLGGLMWLVVASGILIMKISKQEDK